MSERKHYIETHFPTQFLNAQVTMEKGGNAFKGVHRWYSRKPLSFSRASVLAAALPEDVSEVEFLELLGMENLEARQYYDTPEEYLRHYRDGTRLYKKSPTDRSREKIRNLVQQLWGKDRITVLDPFAGGGSIPFEALRCGFDVIANDLNPVAVTTMKAGFEFPLKFGKELQRDINHYIEWIGEQAKQRLAPFFPEPEGQKVQNYLWAHTCPCEFCGTVVPLSPTWWLDRTPASKKKHAWAAARPFCVEGDTKVHFEIIRGKAAGNTGIQGPDGETYIPEEAQTMSSGTGTCPNCQRNLAKEYIYKYGREQGLGHQLYAVAHRDGSNSRLQFRIPTEEELSALETVLAKLEEMSWLIPSTEIPWGVQFAERSSLLQQGITTWDKCCNPRQLLSLVTLLECIHEAIEDMQQQGWDGERIEAVATYLALVLDRCVDKNSRLGIWDSHRNCVQRASTTHALNLMWNYPASNGATRLWPWCADAVAKDFSVLVDWLPGGKGEQVPSVQALQEDGSSLFEFADGTVDLVVTDPPYHDAIQYAELSDFFYVWQHKALEPLFLERLQDELTNKVDEAVMNTARQRDPELLQQIQQGLEQGESTKALKSLLKKGAKEAKAAAVQTYQEKMAAAFGECHRVLQDDGLMVIQFNHKEAGAWDALSQALMQAGFVIRATWSVNTESPENLHQANKNAVSSTVILSCRKRQSVEPSFWDDVRKEVRSSVLEAAERLESWGMEGIDLLLGCFGPALEVMSRHYPVLHQDDTEVAPHEILQITREALVEHLFQRYTHGDDLQLDPEMRLYAMLWSILRANAFDFDEARQIALAVGVTTNTLEARKILKKNKGNLVFLSPQERWKKRAFDVTAPETFLSQVDILHVLLCLHEDKGVTGVRALVDEQGWANDQTIQQILQVAYQILPQTDKYPLRHQLRAMVLGIDSWAEEFENKQLWDLEAERATQVDEEKGQMGLL